MNPENTQGKLTVQLNNDALMDYPTRNAEFMFNVHCGFKGESTGEIEWRLNKYEIDESGYVEPYQNVYLKIPACEDPKLAVNDIKFTINVVKDTSDGMYWYYYGGSTYLLYSFVFPHSTDF